MEWRKSSHSLSQNCVQWRKSTYSNPSGCCVEVAGAEVRDSKLVGPTLLGDRSPHLRFSNDAWAEFLSRVRAGTAVS